MKKQKSGQFDPKIVLFTIKGNNMNKNNIQKYHQKVQDVLCINCFYLTKNVQISIFYLLVKSIIKKIKEWYQMSNLKYLSQNFIKLMIMQGVLQNPHDKQIAKLSNHQFDKVFREYCCILNRGYCILQSGLHLCHLPDNTFAPLSFETLSEN